MVERHIIQARARAMAEEERATQQAEAQTLEASNVIKLPPGVCEELPGALHPDSPAVNIFLHLPHCPCSGIFLNILKSYHHKVLQSACI